MEFEAILRALGNFASLELWLVIVAGSVIGLIFGLIPGISGMLAIALILPFVWVMPPIQVMPLLLTISARLILGNSVT